MIDRTSAARIFAGAAVRGLFATGLMSVAFVAAQRAGAIDTLPPRLIVDKSMPGLAPRTLRLVATVAHFAFGAAAGALYRLFGARSSRSGVLYGLLIWGSSYELWVPAAGILPPAHRDRPPRAAAIAAAHVIYGLVLGLAGTLQRPGIRPGIRR